MTHRSQFSIVEIAAHTPSRVRSEYFWNQTSKLYEILDSSCNLTSVNVCKILFEKGYYF